MKKKRWGHILAIFGCLCVYQMWKLMGLIILAYIVNPKVHDVEPSTGVIVIVTTMFLTSLAMVAYLMIKEANTHFKALKELRNTDGRHS